MNSVHRISVAGLIAVNLVACATEKAIDVTLPKVPKGPLPGAPTAVARTGLSPFANRPKRITKLVIGLGSGLYGFTTAELRPDGRVTLVLDDPNRKHRYIEVTSVRTLQEIADMLESSSLMDCLALGGRYTTGLSDGTQGFLSLEDEHSKFFTYCDNSFPPSFQRAWQDIDSFIQRQPKTTWRIKGEADGFSVYKKAKPDR
jgi:hypothetical protein